MIAIAALATLALAGDIPEQLLSDDAAAIFFGELVSYNTEGPVFYAEIIPTRKIKGDVLLNTNVTYQSIEPIGGFEPKSGNIYLFAYLNGSGYFFETTSRKPQGVQLCGTVGDMWERFEKHLNDRVYEKADEDRLARLNAPEPVGTAVTLTEFLGVDKNSAEEVTLHYRPYIVQVDKDEFYALADKIILTDIENAPMEKTTDGINYSFPNGIYITINGFDGYAFVSNDCTVDRYGMHMSRLPMSDYSIEEESFQALCTLLPEEAQAEFENRTDNIRYYVAATLFALALILAVVGIIVNKKKKSC